ncbi:MAG: TIGR00282 family metallophosphoesterase [Opitutales bacterium]
MRIFFIGDVVGNAGRRILAENLKDIVSKEKIDLVICNGENAAGGSGITKNIAQKLFSYGIDVITLGDHLWDQRCLEAEIDSIDNMCRPANIPPDNKGKEYIIIEKNGLKVGVFGLLGQTLVKIKADCPFRGADRMYEELKDKCDIIFLDFHAETTSEKVAMAYHLNGRVQAVIGTHTHVPTCDGRILSCGTAFMSDAGMTGPWDSCLGRSVEPILAKFLDGRPRQFTVAQDDLRICACIVDIEDKKAVSIKNYIYPDFNNGI